MPTPFYHLSVAGDLLLDPRLKELESIHSQRAAFLFGNTAPDVQTVSGQERRATHFFDLPVLPGAQPPWKRMLFEHPALATPGTLQPAPAAFIGGYLCHLQADWYWVQQVFIPAFGPQRLWSSFRRRLYLHNVLRAYLDQDILARLPEGMGEELARLQANGWLPFTSDQALGKWRDLISRQLLPGAASETVEVLSGRHGLPPGAFYELLSSEQRMEEEVFVHLPRRVLDDYRRRVLEENIILLQDYWKAS